MISQFVADLDRPVSHGRLGNYPLTIATTGDHLAMKVNSFQNIENIELLEALYHPSCGT